jgi:hypothetical protein
MALVLKHATLAQLGAAFRERFKASEGVETARLAKWLLERIQDGTFTETQVRNFFGLTLVQWNALKAKIQTLRDKYADVLAAEGE